MAGAARSALDAKFKYNTTENVSSSKCHSEKKKQAKICTFTALELSIRSRRTEHYLPGAVRSRAETLPSAKAAATKSFIVSSKKVNFLANSIPPISAAPSSFSSPSRMNRFFSPLAQSSSTTTSSSEPLDPVKVAHSRERGRERACLAENEESSARCAGGRPASDGFVI